MIAERKKLRKMDTPNPFELFDDEIDPSLRSQILRYHMSSVLSDKERAKLFGLHETCRIRENAKIIWPENLKCGENVWIGEGAILDASGGLEIGSHTSIGLGVFVWTHSSHKLNRKMENVQNSPEIVRKPTKIGDGVFLAGPSVVLPGVTIGNKAVISPMSLVDRDVDEGEMFSTVRKTSKEIKSLRAEIRDLNARLQSLEGEQST